jgi:hypothetical protein
MAKVYSNAMVWRVLATVAFAASAFSQSNSIPVLTVCEALRDIDGRHGQSVIIVGRAVSTSEGCWLSEDCGLKVHRTILGQDRFFEDAVSTDFIVEADAPPPLLPAGFKWDEAAL